VWAVSHGCRKRKRERERERGGGGGGEGEREEGKRGREGTCEGGGRGEQRKEATRTMRRKLGRERERERERERMQEGREGEQERRTRVRKREAPQNALASRARGTQRHIGGPRGTAADRGSEWWSRERGTRRVPRERVGALSGRTGSAGPASRIQPVVGATSLDFSLPRDVAWHGAGK